MSTQNPSQTSSKITHDLRNYIGGISGIANIINDNIKNYQARQQSKGLKLDQDLEELYEFAAMLAPHCQEALRYLEKMLEPCSPNQLADKKIEQCDLEILINDLVKFHQDFANKNQVTIELEIAKNLPPISCDIFKLKQILINLITNAIKYSNIASKVKIGAHQNNSKIQITIADSGIGMSANEIAMALNGAGQNIDKSGLNKPIDSHGLGLPIVKELVEILGGEMKIESEKGKGTKVVLGFNCQS